MNRYEEWLYSHSPAFLQSAFVTFAGARLAWHKYRHGYESFRFEIEATQWYGPKEMAAYQGKKLREVMHHAYTSVPFYRRVFRRLGLTLDDIRTTADLRKLPVTRREDVRRAPQDFQAQDIKRSNYLVRHTAGTTGKPLLILWEKRAIMREYAFVARHRSWGGVLPGDRHAHFGGRSIVPVERAKPPFWRYNAAERQTYFSAYHLTNANLPSYVEKIRQLEPLYVQGFPSSIHILARFALDHDLNLPATKSVFTSTETLLDNQRSSIEEAFHTRVLDRYGQTELVSAITQCPEGSYHINSDYGVVELVRNGESAAPGEVGELLSTGFVNRGTALIRFESGDTARPAAGDCECGRNGLPVIEALEGRVDDYVVTPDGRIIGRLDHVYKDLTSIVESQIIQESPERLLVKVVPSQQYTNAVEAQLLAEVRKRVGDSMDIEVRVVSEIPRGPNGKFRSVVSDIPNPFKWKEAA